MWGDQSDLKEHILRDPVHGIIRLDLFNFVKPIVDAEIFQRLRRIAQLGVSSVTYPSATHSRFQHALGTMHVFHLLYDHLLHFEDIKQDEKERLLRLGCACALLHDIGHGPLSHASEKLFNFAHEDITSQFIDESEIGIILDKYEIDRAHMKDILGGTAKRDEKLISQLISSQFDADRLDYLSRDAYFTGVGFGNIDLNRMANILVVNHSGGPLDGYALSLPKARYSLESYLLSRHLMYQAVYYHKATRGAELLLRSALNRARDISEENSELPNELDFMKNGNVPTYKEIIELDDHLLYKTLYYWRKSDDEILSDLSRRFINRVLLKSIELTRARMQQYIGGVDKKLEKLAHESHYDSTYYFPIDSHSDAPYEPYSIEKGEEQSVMTSIFVYNDEEQPTEISRLSGVVQALSATLYTDRLYFPERLREDVYALFR